MLLRLRKMSLFWKARFGIPAPIEHCAMHTKPYRHAMPGCSVLGVVIQTMTDLLYQMLVPDILRKKLWYFR